MPLTFAVTFDYLCPFARNLNEHVVAGLRAGADWDVAFTPYSLAQGHVEESGPDVWDRPDVDDVSGLLALQAGLAVRDTDPDHFLDAHWELFAARHDHGGDLRDVDVLRRALDKAGVDSDRVLALVERGAMLPTLRAEHDDNVHSHHVWGVPTLVTRERAVFLRLMERPDERASDARQRIERLVQLVDEFPELHEFKQTDLPA